MALVVAVALVVVVAVAVAVWPASHFIAQSTSDSLACPIYRIYFGIQGSHNVFCSNNQLHNNEDSRLFENGLASDTGIDSREETYPHCEDVLERVQKNTAKSHQNIIKDEFF